MTMRSGQRGRRFRRSTAKPARLRLPKDIRAKLLGSGTASPDRLKDALNVGNGSPPTMSWPIRSQSGARSSFRIQDWRSVTPGGNGDGGPIGLGAESQKKSP